MKYKIRDHGKIEYGNQLYWLYWCYIDDETRHPFMAWCNENLNDNAIICPRFNSGVPMIEVMIMNDEDLALFKLRWAHAL